MKQRVNQPRSVWKSCASTSFAWCWGVGKFRRDVGFQWVWLQWRGHCPSRGGSRIVPRFKSNMSAPKPHERVPCTLHIKRVFRFPYQVGLAIAWVSQLLSALLGHPVAPHQPRAVANTAAFGRFWGRFYMQGALSIVVSNPKVVSWTIRGLAKKRGKVVVKIPTRQGKNISRKPVVFCLFATEWSVPL